MRNRYRKPAPRLDDLDLYLRDAQPTLGDWQADPEATEARRVEGVAALQALGRDYLNAAGDPNRLLAMPLQLRRFFMINGMRILLSDDPVEAMRRFLGQKPRRRGRPVLDNNYRDLTITEDVQIRVEAGSNIADACCVVGKAAHLSSEAIRNIYFARRNDLAVRAAIALRALWKLEGDAAADKPGAPNSG